MDFRTVEGRDRWDAVVRRGDALVVGLDFDGTLSPIVDDPDAAAVHPEVPATLVELGDAVRAVAIVTGRPVAQVLRLGDLEDVGRRLGDGGHELAVLGQYGNERWSSRTGEVVSPEPPEGLERFADALPGLLREHDAADAFVEDKGIALAVHTRRLPAPHEALERLSGPVRSLAEEHDLVVEPGRMVIEVRAPGMHKGQAVRTLTDELDAGAWVFCGDDLGDVEAFRAVADLREGGLPGLLVCSAASDQPRVADLEDLADVVVDGPAGVVAFLSSLVTALAPESPLKR